MTRPGSAAELAEQATAGILAGLGQARRGVVVDSPPGAGKSTLVVRVAADFAGAGERVMVVAQTNEQVDDLTDRLAGTRPDLAVGRLAATGYTPPERVARHPHVALATNAADLTACPVVLSTAHKWAMTRTDAPWPWAIVDEAYQMRSDLLIPNGRRPEPRSRPIASPSGPPTGIKPRRSARSCRPAGCPASRSTPPTASRAASSTS